MMLDNLQYDNILLNYDSEDSGVGNGLVLYVLYIAYCFMMPIIFLNLLVSDERYFLVGIVLCEYDQLRLTVARNRSLANFEYGGISLFLP